MIPNIIHYCWYGQGELSPLAKRCIESWKLFAPNFEIMLWDESNLEFNSPVITHAKKNKQWAFLSDIARLKILYKYGGLYLDVDVELVKPIEDLIKINDFIIGEESPGIIAAGVIACRPNHPLIEKLISDLEAHQKNSSEFIPMPKIISKAIIEWHDTNIFIAPVEYFYPFNPYDRSRSNNQLMFSDITNNTFAIHHYQKSWKLGFVDLMRSKLRSAFNKLRLKK